MTPHDPHPDDSRLQALFDRTAEEPTGAQLTRLAARAAEVPGRSRRLSWPVWLLGPALAATAALVLVLRTGGPAADSPATEIALSVPRQTIAQGAASLTAEAPVAPSYDEIFPAAATAMFTGEVDDFDPLGGSLEGPTSDDDLDAWLAAADEILGGG